MTRVFIPREYQHLAIDHLVNNDRCALWAELGMGKTSSVLYALEKLNWIEDMYPALVVAPLRVAKDTWFNETQKWSTFKHIVVSPIVGGLDERMAALRKPAHIHTVNFEQIPWLVTLLGRKWPWKNLIIDESTKLSGFRTRQGTERSKKLYEVVKEGYCDRIWELSGKPAPSGLKSLWGQLYFIDQGKRLGSSFKAFSERWFSQSWDGFGLDPLPFTQEQIQDAISDICLSIRAEDWFDIKEPLHNTISIKLPPDARKLYKQMEKEMFLEIKEKGVEAFNAGGKRNYCMQLADGHIYTRSAEDKRLNRAPSSWEEVHDEKYKALESIIEEANGNSVLVAYHFRFDLPKLLKRFKGSVDISTDKGMKMFMDGSATTGLAHPASMGHGIDGLQNVCHRLTYFSHNDNLDNHDQILGRINSTRQIQAGFDRNVFVNHIVAADTVEEYAVLPNLLGKGKIQDLLMNAMKRIQI